MNTILLDEQTKAIESILTFLGTGSAFTKRNWQSNMLLSITADDLEVCNLLIDCGGDARHSLNEQNYNYQEIDAIYISHLHSDHIGGLEWIALTTYFDPGAKKVKLIGQKDLLVELWEDCLKGGLSTLEGVEATLETYFDVVAFEDNEKFRLGGQVFEPIRIIHYMNNCKFAPSYGLRWVAPDGTKIFLTTDTQHCPNQIKAFYEWADVIFQDCEIAEFPSGVHAHFSELKTLPLLIKAKMRLYHYQDDLLPPAKAEGFHGFVVKGDNFFFDDPTREMSKDDIAFAHAVAEGAPMPAFGSDQTAEI